MENQWVISMKDLSAVQYTCTICKKRFVRSLEELQFWRDRARTKAEPLCPFCGDAKQPENYREIRGVIENVVNLWESEHTREIELRFVISAKREMGEK